MRRTIPVAAFILAFPVLVISACSSAPPEPAAPAMKMLELPSDPAKYAPHPRFEPMVIPADNPITVEKATLGWQLWFDTRLSGKGDRSCYGCHVNEKGLTDGLTKNTSATDGKPLARHTPTMWNIGYHQQWYWDGRAKTLEGQALAAWKLANMGARDPDPAADKIRDDVLARINAVPSYAEQFKKVFGGPATETTVTQALATYMRTIVSRATAFDRFEAGDKTALSEAAVRGWETFQRAKCTNCHSGALFTDLQFHNVGIGVMNGKPTDVGRFTVTKTEKDTGAFKTPTLRDVARSAPYFHDGSVATLDEAVKLMANGGISNKYLDKENLQRQKLSDAELKDIIAFLESLTETTALESPQIPQ
jgi:cytochrome c peroxidase